MRTILRAGLGALLGLALTFGPALAIEYDDIFELTDKGVSDETIVQLIVDDGRAFELSNDEIADLQDAGVSDVVIDAMLDPETGRDWLAGDRGTVRGSGGYATSLDEAYGQGYADGRSTALVYSFGYYYGPLSRYYYCDPFYYPFWSSGYSYSYWPSYYAYWYRPAYSWYSAYPYNWYTYSSYYCYTYYDPGYWVSHGYHVQPGYGRTIWDDGPRWRDGGIAPPKGGRPDATVDVPATRVVAGRTVDGSGRRLRGPSGPPAIREALVERTPTGRSAGTRVDAGIGRRGAVERGSVARGDRPAARGGMRDVSSGRVIRSRPDAPARTPSTQVGRREAVGRSPARRGTTWSGGDSRVERRLPPPSARVIRPAREQARERARDEAREPAEARRNEPAPPAREPAKAEREPARRDDGDRGDRGGREDRGAHAERERARDDRSGRGSR